MPSGLCLPAHPAALRLLLAVAVPLATACAPEASGSDDPRGADANEPADLEEIVGRSFVAQRVVEDGREKSLVAGSSPWISFHAPQELSLSAGCNTGGGRYTIRDGVLTVSEFGSSEIGCEDPLMAQEQWYFGLFSKPINLELHGNQLVVESGNTRVEYLDQEEALPDLQLVGPTWTIIELTTSEIASSGAWPQPATLRFDEATLHFFDGCVHGTASYTRSETEITLREVVRDAAVCTDPLALMLSSHLSKVLINDQVLTFDVRANHLAVVGRDSLGFGATGMASAYNATSSPERSANAQACVRDTQCPAGQLCIDSSCFDSPDAKICNVDSDCDSPRPLCQAGVCRADEIVCTGPTGWCTADAGGGAQCTCSEGGDLEFADGEWQSEAKAAAQCPELLEKHCDDTATTADANSQEVDGNVPRTCSVVAGSGASWSMAVWALLGLGARGRRRHAFRPVRKDEAH